MTRPAALHHQLAKKDEADIVVDSHDCGDDDDCLLLLIMHHETDYCYCLMTMQPQSLKTERDDATTTTTSSQTQNSQQQYLLFLLLLPPVPMHQMLKKIAAEKLTMLQQHSGLMKRHP